MGVLPTVHSCRVSLSLQYSLWKRITSIRHGYLYHRHVETCECPEPTPWLRRMSGVNSSIWMHLCLSFNIIFNWMTTSDIDARWMHQDSHIVVQLLPPTRHCLNNCFSLFLRSHRQHLSTVLELRTSGNDPNVCTAITFGSSSDIFRPILSISTIHQESIPIVAVNCVLEVNKAANSFPRTPPHPGTYVLV